MCSTQDKITAGTEGVSGKHGLCVVHADKMQTQNCTLTRDVTRDVSLPHAAVQAGIQSAQRKQAI